MNTISRAALLTLYTLALAALFFPLPGDAGPAVQRIALITIAIHVLELCFVFKHVRAYAGPLSSSVALTLLFGLLHWLPIARAQTASGHSRRA